ncbi:RNA polymerase subunit sigma-24 [Mycolicibacterium porcinum]|uniref:RNA polymerase sigma factor SigJ n=1 Tax=Mycolicibacterium porcinum TaxID=39693 RepID=UPI00080BA42B|nr:RNA polymerase sigma factor SigJ [Mycolicibacterium porcinum]OCB15754.1 RNA polymerase subunit sigma-24 [Mycolicibacterium porcinum]
MTPDDISTPDNQDPGLTAVMRERRHLINLTYRLLGSVTDAEDAVQETYVRWYAMAPRERETIKSPGAWLTTVAGRICLDLLGSARARRESYVGPWVPEPLPETADWIGASETPGITAGDPADRITLDESVTMAFLVTLESMTPAERVALILHDVFGFSFPEVSEIVGRTAGACRQLASSARQRARTHATTPMPRSHQADTVLAFKKAWEAQDIDALLRVLDPDATAIADGGGVAPAALSPIVGALNIARHYLALAAAAPDDVTVVECTVNGQPSLAVHYGDATVTVFAFEIANDRIKRIWAVRNPDKLTHWQPAATGQSKVNNRSADATKS